MDRVNLEVRQYDGPDRWYWALSDSAGAYIESHEVELPQDDWQWTAFTRLSRYLRLNVNPASPLSSEAQIIDEVGRWIGEKAFGPIGPALVDRAPVTVAVHFPSDAEVMMFRPWELAVAGDLPLAMQDVSLVMLPSGAGQPKSKDAVGGELRMLAVFSLPDAAPSLVLREQRQALVRLVDGIRKRKGKAIELTVLQYDVNRDRLRNALEYGAGWDIVHFSGHGLVDGLVLENPDGEQDTVPTSKLIDLLRPNRSRLKLLVLSSCNSAAAPPVDALTGRFGQITDGDGGGNGDGGVPERSLSVLAKDAVLRLDCGVLAMRYAVDDDFSITLAEELYSLMLDSVQPLTRALQLALPKALGDRSRPGVPPLSVGIPALFGSGCLDLTLAPPTGPRATFGTDRKMAHFPDEPEHLVGRSGVMGQAARVLGGDGPVGIMFTGPAGIGKTACAVELAYRHEDSFGALAEWTVPASGSIGSLRVFAQALEQQLAGFKMVDDVSTRDRLAAFLPKLTELAEREAILILIDGIDSLLTSTGYWHDPFWEKVITALLSHHGFSRLVLTGCQPPRDIPDGLHIAQLGPLTPQESVLLARQLPTLGSLIRGFGHGPIQTAKLLLAEALTSAAGNPAAICARDRELSGVNLAQVSPSGILSPDYADLIDRWTNEIPGTETQHFSSKNT